MAERLQIEDLAARVSDGAHVDWAVERGRARDHGELRLVEALASLDKIASAVRTSGVAVLDASKASTELETGIAVGSFMGSYRIEELIGRGGMGLVYRAHDTRLNWRVAIKVLAPELAADQVASRRFLGETQHACRVSHPYVAKVHDVVEQDGRVMLVMEWIRGKTLDQILADGPLPSRRGVELGAEIAEALEAVHRNGLVHRDLKPGNVMLSDDGHVRVMDFGVALHLFYPEDAVGTPRTTRERLTARDRRVGTLRHMSPEQLRGEDLDARSDLFALGILLWEMLTGSHPFRRPTSYETANAILNDPPGSESGADALPDVRGLRELVLKLLEKDPALRFESAAEVATELRSIASSAGMVVPVPPAPVPAPRWGVRVGAAALLVVVVAVAGVAIHRWPPPSPPSLPAVAVFPFTDRDGTPASLRGEMIASLVGAGLSESGLLRPVDLERVAEAFGPRPVGRDVAAGGASKLHAGWIVDGQVWTENATLAGMVRIYRAGSSQPVAEHPLRAGGPSGLAAIVATRVLEAVAPNYRGDAPALASAGTTSDEAREQLARARAAMRLADYASAIAALERAVAADPSFAEARTALAAALHAAGWGRRAREEAARAVKDAERAGASIPARVVLEARAVAAQIDEKWEDERAARRALVERYRDDPVALTGYADVLRRAGKRDEAAGIVAQAEALDPGDLRILLTKASILTADERYGDAEAILDKASHELGPDSPADARARIAMQQGQVAMTRGDDPPAAIAAYSKAETLFREAHSQVLAARAHGAQLDVKIKQGNLEVVPADYKPSLDAFRSAGALVDVVDTLTASGARDLAAGEVVRAEATLRSAIQEGRILDNPALLVETQLNLAEVLSAVGRSAESEGIASEAVAIARAHAMRDASITGLLILAQVKTWGGRLSEAREDYRAGADLARAPDAVGDRLGFALMGVADIDELFGVPKDGLDAADEAVNNLRKRKQPMELTNTLIVRARLKSQIADWDGSQSDLAEAERLTTSQGAAVGDQVIRLELASAWRLLQLGRFDDAVKGFEKAKGKTKRPDLRAYLASATLGLCGAQLAAGHLAQADTACRTAEGDPSAMANERTQAHALLAEIALRSKRHDEAERWARRAVQESHDGGLVPVELRALATLTAVPRVADRGEVERRGAALLKLYLENVPGPRREAVRRRADWKSELERFDRTIAAG